jgi:hypothetical protein
MRVRPSNEPPLSVFAPSPYSLNLSEHPLDLLRRIKTVIDRNRALAKSLGITGTPGFIGGTESIPGVLDVNGRKDLVARRRAPAGEAVTEGASKPPASPEQTDQRSGKKGEGP